MVRQDGAKNARRRNLPIQHQSLIRIGDVLVVDLEVDAQVHRRAALVVKILPLQFADRVFQQLHIELEAYGLDLPALLPAEQVAGATDLEILLGKQEAIDRGGHRGHALTAVVGLRVGEQEAPARPATAADTTATNGCGECHSGTHNPFAREWKLSGHSQTWEASHNSTDPYCQGCHTGQGALLTWQKGGNYAEKGSTNMEPATCAVCHDPHGNTGVDKQLRFPLNAANLESNLCIKCHQRRGTSADAVSMGRNSVHSPEGPTLLGMAGWFPPGMSPADSLVATHGSSTKNPKLCATCHVQAYQGTDPVTKQAVFSTGHRFLATPCVGANGLPLDSQTGCVAANMTFRSCLASGCHGTETAARNAMNTANLRIANLVTQANTLITQAKAGAKGAECTFSATKPYSTCMGMQFNISVATKVFVTLPTENEVPSVGRARPATSEKPPRAVHERPSAQRIATWRPGIP